MSQTTHMRIPNSVYDKVTEVQNARGFATRGEALRFMVREGGYDV